MACKHDGFHAIGTTYDNRTGVLVYHWTCEGCGKRLREAGRQEYRPQFDPRGNERYMTATAQAVS
jgi:hypothetical protein